MTTVPVTERNREYHSLLSKEPQRETIQRSE